jgi:hypothetical protein
MKDKTSRCVVTTTVNEEDKEAFAAIACSLGIPFNALMRRLILFFLDRKISWSDIFGQDKALSVAGSLNNSKKKQVRTPLSPEQYSVFARRVEELGSTTAIVARRLILLYIAGEIGRREIWY